jgi:hypothetical protein
MQASYSKGASDREKKRYHGGSQGSGLVHGMTRNLEISYRGSALFLVAQRHSTCISLAQEHDSTSLILT